MTELDAALGLIRLVPDYPHPGILFRDITPLIGDASAFSVVTRELAGQSSSYTHVAGIEARGFIFGAALASSASKGFIPLRKAGKLPHDTLKESYGLEYGEDELEVHKDAASTGDRILLIDDVLATGGTALAALKLIAALGATCEEVVFLLEIADLGGRAKILAEFPQVAIRSLVMV